MKRTNTAPQMAITATAARPCDLGHGYGAALMSSWSKQDVNEFTTAPSRRLRKRTT